ncbi:unnamed protein product [Rhizopus stolonifer]
MPLNDISIDNFTRILKTFNKDNGYDIAKEYATLTLEDENDTFKQAESNTWSLLATIIDQKSKSLTYKIATLKDWVAKVSVGQDLEKKIQQKTLEDEEIEEDIMQIVRNNRSLRPCFDEPPSKKIKMSDKGQKDNTFKQRWTQLRTGEYERVICRRNEDPTAVYLYNEYIRYHLIALEKDSSKYTEKEWMTWHECVKNLAKDPSAGIYERLLYSTLAGDINSLLKSSTCQSWEDVVWANLNTTALEGKSDMMHILPVSVFNLAASKDQLLERGDPRLFFHKVQTFIIQNNIDGLFEELYSTFVKKKFYYIKPEFIPEALRFIATLVLYGRHYFGWTNDEKLTAIVGQFTELYAQDDHFKPLAIAIYTSKLSKEGQLLVYSQFLQDFVGDEQEITILIHLGKQHSLHMKEILERTSSRLIEKAIDSITLKHTEEKTMDHFKRAVGWLTADKTICLVAIRASNYIIRYLLNIHRLDLAQEIYKAIPEETEWIASKTMDMEHDLDEYRSHKRFLNVFRLRIHWDELLSSSPKDDGSLDTLITTLEWRHTFKEHTELLERELMFVLEGGWLRPEMPEMEHVTKSDLQYKYIPELVIQYHQLLHLSSNIIPENLQKSKEMGTYINVKQRELFYIIMKAKKMKDVVKELGKSFIDYYKPK